MIQLFESLGLVLLNMHVSCIRCVNAENIEYPYSLYLLVFTVRDVSDTGTQIHLLFY
jgi:hypothetical protein